jgi:hypothetical protein
MSDFLQKEFEELAKKGNKELTYKEKKVSNEGVSFFGVPIATGDKGLPEVQDTVRPFEAAAQEGFLDIPRGAKYYGEKGLEAVGIMPEGSADAYKQSLAPIKQEYGAIQQEFPVQSFLGEMAGGAIATAPVGAPGAALAKAGMLPGMLAGKVGQGMITGAAQGAVASGLDIDNTDAGLLKSAAVGGLMGAGLGAVGGAIPKAYDAGKNMLSGFLKPKVGSEKQEAIQAVAKEIGLEPTFAQITGSKNAEAVEGFMAGVPFSRMRAQRTAQADQVEPAVTTYIKNLRGKLGDVPEETFYKNVERIKTKVGQEASANYSYVAKLAKEANLKPNTDVIKTFLSEQMQQYSELPGGYAEKITKEVGKQMQKIDNLDFDNVQSTIKYLNKVGYKKYLQASNGTALPDEYKFYYSLRDKYLDSLIPEGGGEDIKKAAIYAKDFYAKEYAPFNSPEAQAVINQEISVDKFLKTMLPEAKAGKSSEFLGKLDDQAKQSMRADFLKSIQSEATNPDGSFNSKAFLNKVHQYNALYPDIFEKELPKFEAFSSLLTRVHPEKDLSNLQLGSGATIGGIGASIAAVTYPTTLAAVLPAGGALWLYSKMATNPRGIAALQSLSKIKPNSNPQIANRIQTIATNIMNQFAKKMPTGLQNKQQQAEDKKSYLQQEFENLKGQQ